MALIVKSFRKLKLNGNLKEDALFKMRISQIPGYLSRARKSWVPIVYLPDNVIEYFEAAGNGLDYRLMSKLVRFEDEVPPELDEALPPSLDVLGVAVDAILEVLETCKFPVIFISDAAYRKKSAPFTTGKQEFLLDGLLSKISLKMLMEEEVVVPLIKSIAWEAGGGLLFGECKDPNWQTLSDIKGYKSFGFLCAAFEAYGYAIYCTKSFANRLPEICNYDWEDD